VVFFNPRRPGQADQSRRPQLGRPLQSARSWMGSRRTNLNRSVTSTSKIAVQIAPVPPQETMTARIELRDLEGVSAGGSAQVAFDECPPRVRAQ